MDAKRLRQLEDKNAKLKRLLAEAMLDNAMLTLAERYRRCTYVERARSLLRRGDAVFYESWW